MGRDVSQDISPHGGKPTNRTSSNDETNNLVLVEDSGLISLQSRPSLMAYSKQLWQRRHFIKAQANAKSFQTGQGMFLGRVWIILTPIISIATYAFIFGMVLKIDRGMDNFIGFLTLGVIFFGFISKGLSGGSGLIKSSKSLIAAFSFPKATLVVSSILRMSIDNAIPAVIAVIATVLMQLDQPFHWTIVLVFPLYFLMHIFIAGLLFMGARITAFIPDIKSVISVVNRGLFFTSGVFFSIDRFATHPAIEVFLKANPIYQMLVAVRSCVMDGEVPSLNVWLYISGWSFGLCIIGYLYFWRAEERYANVK